MQFIRKKRRNRREEIIFIINKLSYGKKKSVRIGKAERKNLQIR
jgi:hypothetical protein